MSIVSIRSHSAFFQSCGTVFVTTSFVSCEALIVSMALPLRMPWVTMAMADFAPWLMTTSAALQRVPHVSAMSSTMIATLSLTSPTRTMRETSLGRARSLWMRAKPKSRPSAIDVALLRGVVSVERRTNDLLGWIIVAGDCTPLCSTSVWRDDDTVLDVQVLAYPAQRARLGVEVVDRDIEEALDLRCVQVHGDDVVTARRLEHVGHESCGDRGARLVFLVLARVGEVGKDCGYATG